jgi:hypothetical protein
MFAGVTLLIVLDTVSALLSVVNFTKPFQPEYTDYPLKNL